MAEKKTETLPVKAEAEEVTVVQASSPDVDMPPEMVTELVERRLEGRTRILRAALNKGVIGKGAFTLHGSGDRAKPSLNGEAVMRMAPILGIVVEFAKDDKGDLKFTKRTGKDNDADEPRFYEYEIAARGWYAERPSFIVEAIGSASTRDGFFKRKPSYNEQAIRQPLEAVSEGDVRKKCRVNAWSRVGSVLLGVKGLSIEEIEAAGYSFDDSTTIAHDGKGASRRPMRSPRPASAGKDDPILKKIGDALMAMAGNDKEIASGMLADFTRFEGNRGPVQVESLSDPKFTDKWRFRTWGEKIKPAYEEWLAQQEPAPPPDGELAFPDDPPEMPEEEVPF